ncbi:hypothetical protein BNATCHR291 (nucleomorph) [Bigelowiella natans]|uniref:Uncharacterized protein n=1 Tax=Bigelowiella natans TaxID=227086 RepID=Q3LW86_BIGNA|nr:hypothetical protein BNATCHR291 [Bigelowiella natans]ABA27280.1 hypothetical protein [Bigelowiella natans]
MIPLNPISYNIFSIANLNIKDYTFFNNFHPSRQNNKTLIKEYKKNNFLLEKTKFNNHYQETNNMKMYIEPASFIRQLNYRIITLRLNFEKNNKIIKQLLLKRFITHFSERFIIILKTSSSLKNNKYFLSNYLFFNKYLRNNQSLSIDWILLLKKELSYNQKFYIWKKVEKTIKKDNFFLLLLNKYSYFKNIFQLSHKFSYFSKSIFLFREHLIILKYYNSYFMM